MGCNCKSKQVQSKPQIIREGDITVISQPSKPNYSREEINRAINYVRGVTNAPEERRWTVNFHNSHFSEQLIPSCASCWERVKSRMEHLNQKLTEYEQYESSRQTT
jgi:hypothetical protein